MQDRIEFTTFASCADRNWSQSADGVTIFIGENGAGKSRILSRIENESLRRGKIAIAIANTPYDKFRQAGNQMYRLLNRQGSTVPHKAIKLAISNAIENDELSLRRISRILRYCGFLPDVGIRISLRAGQSKYSRSLDITKNLESNDADEVLALCNLLLQGDIPKEIIWFDFDSGYSEYSYRSLLPRVLRWEKLLRDANILSSVALYLRKPGQTISLAKASSGELSLVSTVAFLTSTLVEGAIVLIDEPENSLHPRWQREYLSLLQEAIGYRDVRVFIATHSPLIVSALLSEDSDSFIRNLSRICVLSSQDEEDVVKVPASVEGILAEIFHTITPANHYLSEALVRLLDEVDASPEHLENAKKAIEKFRAAMPDQKQERILDEVDSMLTNVAQEGA